MKHEQLDRIYRLLNKWLSADEIRKEIAKISNIIII